jgi:hypothetical protein
LANARYSALFRVAASFLGTFFADRRFSGNLGPY